MLETARRRLRGAWNAVRGYAAAKGGRMLSRTARGGGPNGAVSQDWGTLALMARDAVRNNPYAARIVDVWAGNAIGTGITTRWPDPVRAEMWRRWTESTACDAEGVLDYLGLQVLVLRSTVEAGGCFVRLIRVSRSDANPIGLALRVMECDHLDTSRNGVIDGYLTIQGIAVNELGAPVGYWLYRYHPFEMSVSARSLKAASEFVPASEVLHIYRKRRPGQLRDVSWLAPVVVALNQLTEYEAALVMKAKIEACLAAVVSDDSEDGVTGDASGMLTDASGRRVEALEPGMILYRRGAGSVEVVNPAGGGSHVGYAKRSLEAGSVGVGLTYDQLSGDMTGANYSSLKAGKTEQRRICEQVQYGMLIPMLIRPIAMRFDLYGEWAGLWQRDPAAEISHVPPAHEMIDPLKDTLALIAQVRAGFVPLPEAVGSFGYTLRQVVDMMKAANVLVDDAGLSLDTDPRRVAKSGAAHDPAQLAAIEIAATGAAAQ